MPFRVESVNRFVECVEDNLARMPVMERDGQEVEVMYSDSMIDLDADIALRSRHVRRNVKRNRERPALPQKLHYVLQVHQTDERA